jgi:hypothetical protein
MTCEHTNKINEKMSALFGKLGDNNSDLYKEFGPFFKKGDIEAKLKKVEGGFFSNDYEAETFFKKETYINSIVVKKL